MGGDRLIQSRDIYENHNGGDCGCEYHYVTNDVDRPFMCYTERRIVYTKRCEKHEAQRQERIAQAIEERRQDEIKRELKQKAAEDERDKWEAERPQRLEVAKQHILTLINITTNNYTTLSDVIQKYDNTFCVFRAGKLGMYEHFRTNFANMLDIKKQKGKWVCSKERLEAFEPNTLYGKFNSSVDHNYDGRANIIASDKDVS